MKNPKQKMRFTDSELSLIKGLFADNDELLYVIRKVMCQFPLTDTERELLKGSMNENTLFILKKFFLPELDPDAPLFQMTALPVALGADIKTLSPDGAWPYIKAKELEMQYLEQQLNQLKDDNSTVKIKLNDLIDLGGTKARREETYIAITAWNYLLSFIDSNIQQIKFLAGMKEETIEETKARLERDSTK